MAKKRRKNILRLAERFAEVMAYEASGGVMGRKATEVKKEDRLDFNDRRAFLDSLIKLAGAKNKVDPEDEDDGIDSFKEMMNGDEPSGTPGS